MTRVRDVARVELGAETYAINAYLNGTPVTAVAISQLPGSNALAAADAVIAELDAAKVALGTLGVISQVHGPE